ncbi:hypothetical protein AQUCO_01100231v1 [Aquilegia coerulea]|uniref:Uncharacterized protein n=1 Tax=Aquilegia coerulea TaxID=218851 RepID=A0A2G5E670_AQUCA|nr:hypothetical protein AQUCO_01100231v1 [Aquilegia coerulea]
MVAGFMVHKTHLMMIKGGTTLKTVLLKDLLISSLGELDLSTRTMINSIAKEVTKGISGSIAPHGRQSIDEET